jgi:hypothetical protein
MTRKILVLPVIAAAFAAGPALAQMSPETPFPSRNMPGTQTEQRDDNVWQGAINSSRPAYPGGELYTGRASVAGPPLAEPLYAEPYAEPGIGVGVGVGVDDDDGIGVGVGVDADEDGIGVGAGIDLE